MYIYLFIGFYMLLGVGVFSMLKATKKEKPIGMLISIFIWPIFLIVFAGFFIFSGERYGDS